MFLGEQPAGAGRLQVLLERKVSMEALIPRPRNMVVDYSRHHPISPEAARALRSYRFGQSLPAGVVHRKVLPPPGQERFDWHRIVVAPDSITIECGDERALFVAVQTIKALLAAGSQTGLACLTIEDWADFEWRIAMLDISRDRVPTTETLLALIDLLCSLKYNQLQLYMEHTYAYRGHEEVWKDASAITEDELRMIDAYCAERGIELVPNQNSFGHMERWLKFETYRHLGEMPDGFIDPWGVFRAVSTTLAPVDHRSLELIDDLYSQLLPVVRSNLVNVGGDEPWELGQGRSAQRSAEVGVEHVYVEYLAKLHELTSSYGKRMMVWADVLMRHPDSVHLLPPDTIVVDWGYEADHPFEREAAMLSESHFDWIVCVGNSAWNTVAGRWENARLNILRAATAALSVKRRAKGFMVTEWGDNGHFQQLPIGLPGFILGAVAAWNRQEAQVFDIVSAVERVLLTHPALSGGAQIPDRMVAHASAQALMKLERVGELYVEGNGKPPIHNSTLLGALMIDHLAPYYSEAIASFTGHAFERETTLLDEVDALLAAAVSESTRVPLIVHELRWTSSMLRFACALGFNRLAQGDRRVVPTQDIPLAERTRLAAWLDDLIVEYRRLWDSRSRTGGLPDSVRRLESLRALFG